MRAFVALELPLDFEDDVAAMSRVLRRAVDGRFMRRETYHLTLAFLGDVDEVGARSAICALEEACSDMEELELRASGLGTFGRGRDMTLWMGIEPTAEVMRLGRRVREELAARGVAYDGRPFRPHVTLARRVRIPRGQLPNLAFPLPAYAGDVTLFKSELSSAGASYKPLYTVELAPGVLAAYELAAGGSLAC